MIFPNTGKNLYSHEILAKGTKSTQSDRATASSLFSQEVIREDGRSVQLNKGHYCLDTDERLLEFSQKLANGWEQDYAKYRSLWTSLPSTRTIREYPLLLDLELASVCNLKCPMCYTITDEFKSKVTKGFMDFDLVKRIIDEVAGKIYALRLSFRGESLLHKDFIKCVEYAKTAGIQEVSTLTNGAKLNGDFALSVIKAGVDWITISIDGVDEVYEDIRKPITFEKIVDNLRFISDYKLHHGLVKPLIKVQGIWPAVRQNPEKYYDIFSSLADLVAFNPLIDYLRKDTEIIYVDNFSCPQLYQRLVIGSDGKVMMCSNDEDGKIIVGDANSQTIYDIWHSEVLNNYRAIHASCDGYKKLPHCKECYYPRKAEVNETATINGRVIGISNYINRSQDVGS